MTTTTPSRSPRWNRDRARRLLVESPDRLALALLAISIAVIVPLTLGVFDPWLVIPIALVLGVLLQRFAPPASAVSRAWVRGAAVSVGAATAWVIVNSFFAAELLDVIRDPSIYTLTSIWLTSHSSPTMPVGDAISLASEIPALTADLGNFGASDGVVQLQGGDLLPGLMAVGGWIFGLRGALIVNVVLGGIAMIAVYGLARRMIGPLWALIPQCALALSLCFVYLSRTPYSEIVMLATSAAGLTWLLLALRGRRVADFAIAGALLGAGGLARIDGALVVIGPVLALSVALAFGFLALTRKLVIGLGAMIGAATLLLGVGLLDLATHKPSYLANLGTEVRLLMVAYAISLVILIIGLLIARRPIRFSPKVRRVLSWSAGSVVVLAFAFWISRAWWYVSHKIDPDGPYGSVIKGLQGLEGVPIDGSRSYDELSAHWIAWYFSWPLLILGVIGLAWWAARSVSRSRTDLLVVIASALSIGSLYLTQVSITPDQVWAYRRLLPVLTPILLIAAVMAVRTGVGVLRRRWGARPADDKTRRWRRRGIRTVAVILAILPLVSWRPVILFQEGNGQADEITKICDAIQSDIVVMARNWAPANYALTLRSVCDVEVVSGWELDEETLAEVYDRVGAVSVVYFGDDSVPLSGALPPALAETKPTRWTSRLFGLPTTRTVGERVVRVGVLQADGRVG